MLVASALPACGESAAERAVAATLPDPGSARFQNLRERGSHICGEVNFRDESRAYAGYSRFVYDKTADAALVDPRIFHQAVSADPERRACAKPFAYQSVNERIVCAEQPKIDHAMARQRHFELLWHRACS